MQKQSNIETLKKKGVLSNAAAKSLEKSGGVSKRSSTPTYIFLTKDKKEVTPMLYMRGGKGTTPDDKQNKFVEEYNKLVTKYATLKQNKEQ
tara:strand:- start:24773 stop:25045 length:273 start_codon:yes stop_codon:yes gene_type:complete